MSHDTIPTGHTSPSLTATIAAGPDARRAVPESVGPAARGTEIGRYVVLGLLGRGAMGMVYAVYDPKLDRRIALKVLPPDRRIGADDHRARLLREAQALARLNHPNVVAVHDAGVVEEQIFVAMEHLEGQDLQRWQEVPRPWPEVLRTYVQAGRGLEAVHAAGLVHRDFKPANAVLADDGRVRVLDFGLARERVAQDDASSSSIGSTDGDIAPISEGSGVSRVTEAGVVLGTPAYMAPEQFRAQEPDARSDQFGFCVSLYEGLYGERPFEGRTPGMLMQHIVEGRVRDEPRGSKVPRWLREALVRGLAHVPDERWPSMTALLAVLTADRGARRRSLAVGALGVVTVAALGWGVSQSRASPEPTLPTACTEAAARLSGLWDDEQRVAVEEALTRTRTPFAVDVASAVTVRLDRYADDWVAMVTDSCRATHVRGEQSETLLDLRTACLERRRVELGAFVGVMSEADAAVVERAVSAAMKLTPIAVCGDADRLRATVPPPDDPAAAAEVEAIRMQLPAVRSSVNVGRYEEAISRLEQLDERAAAVDHGPVRAEVMALLGFVHGVNGQAVRGAELLERAVWLGTATGADRVVADAAAQLVQVVGSDGAQPQRGLAWVPHAHAALERIGNPATGRARLHVAVGTIYFAQRQWADALASYEGALALTDEITELQRVQAFNLKGSALLELGRVEEAIDEYEHARALALPLVGPNHPTAAQSLNNLGLAYERLEDYDRAESRYLAALELKERILSPAHPSVGATLGNLGNVAAAREDWTGSHAYFSRAWALFVAALPPGHPHLSSCLLGMAEASIAQEEVDRGQAELKQLREQLELRSGNTASHQVELALLEARLAHAVGAHARARQHGARASALLDADLARAEPELAATVAAWMHHHGGSTGSSRPGSAPSTPAAPDPQQTQAQ